MLPGVEVLVGCNYLAEREHPVCGGLDFPVIQQRPNDPGSFFHDPCFSSVVRFRSKLPIKVSFFFISMLKSRVSLAPPCLPMVIMRPPGFKALKFRCR